jgi:hypothetical protein
MTFPLNERMVVLFSDLAIWNITSKPISWILAFSSSKMKTEVRSRYQFDQNTHEVLGELEPIERLKSNDVACAENSLVLKHGPNTTITSLPKPPNSSTSNPPFLQNMTHMLSNEALLQTPLPKRYTQSRKPSSLETNLSYG